MVFKKHNPGEPCCECTLTEFLDQVTQVAGSGGWSLSLGTLTITQPSIEILDQQSHPNSPHSLQLEVKIWAESGGSPIVILASDDTADNCLWLEFVPITNCGEFRVWQRTSGVDSLISQDHVIAPLEVETWYEIILCWDAENQTLTIYLPDNGRAIEDEDYESSTLPSMTLYPTGGIDFPRWGFGTTSSHSGSAKFKDLTVTAIGDSYKEGCPECTTTCDLDQDQAVNAPDGIVRCVWDNGAGWTNVVDPGTGETTYDGTGSLTHKTGIYDANYSVIAYFSRILDGDTVYVYVDGANYVSLTFTDPSPATPYATITVNGGASKSVYLAGATSIPRARIIACVVGSVIFAEVSVYENYPTQWALWTTFASYTPGSAPRSIGVGATGGTGHFLSFSLVRHGADYIDCGGCRSTCTYCPPESIPPAVIAVTIPAGLTPIYCDNCGDVAGTFLVPSWTGLICSFRYQEVLCEDECLYVPGSSTYTLYTTLTILIDIVRISTFPTIQVIWRVRVTVGRDAPFGNGYLLSQWNCDGVAPNFAMTATYIGNNAGYDCDDFSSPITCSRTTTTKIGTITCDEDWPTQLSIDA